MSVFRDGVGVLGIGAGMTQTDAVLEFLRMRGPLTQPVAQEELGCLRLGARIWDLKQRGFAISTELVELASGQRVAEYSLVGSSTGSSTPLTGREPKTRLPRGSSPLAQGKGGSPSGVSGGAEEGDGGGLSGKSGSARMVGGSAGGALVGAGVGLRDGLTLDVALGVFGDLVMELGVSPTVREFGGALGVSSGSVAHRWVRVLEREGLLAVNEQLGQGASVGVDGGEGLSVGGGEAGRRVAARGWVVTSVGFERLYGVERGRRLALERAV